MKKKLFLIMVLSILFAAATAGAAVIEGFVASEYRYFETDFNGGGTQTFMMLSAYTDVNTYDVYLQNMPGAGNVSLTYLSGWDYFTGSYPYLYSGISYSPPPGSSWEGFDYTFYIDMDSSGTLNGEDVQDSTPWNLSSDTINLMAVPSNISVTGDPYHPTFKWNAVTNADWYRIRLFEIVGGTPDSGGGPLDESVRIIDNGSSTYSFEYTGTAFEPGVALAVRLETYDYDGAPGSEWYNRSSYYFEHDPVPIPGAVWLLGSGLIGLAGLRRKLNK